MQKTKLWTAVLAGFSLVLAACLCTNALPTILLGGADEEDESLPTPAEEEGAPSDEAEPKGEEGDEGEEVEPPPDAELPTSVSDDTLGLSMNLPEDWLTISAFGMLTASGDPAMIASIAAGGDPPEPTSLFLVAIALPNADPQMTGTETLDAMTDELLNSLQVGQANSPFSITGQNDLTVDDNPARSFEITGSDPEFGTELDGRVVVIVGTEQVCAILGMAPAALWPAFDATFDHIIASVELYQPALWSAPADPAPPDTAQAGLLIEEADFTGFVFTAEWAEMQRFYRAEGESFWTPTRNDILALEGGLEDVILPFAEAQGYPDLGQRLPDYLRQYIGVMVDERQLIFAALFCVDYGFDWQKELLLWRLEDGGSCLIDLSYDPETDEFLWLSIHGEA